MSNPLYEITSTAWGGREGRAASADGRLDLQLSVPKGLGGDDGPGTNPEELFATGYAACFHSALKMVAGQQKVDVSESAVAVTIGIGGSPDEGFGLSGSIEAELPGLDQETADKLVAAAHDACPYSKATRGNVDISVTATVS